MWSIWKALSTSTSKMMTCPQGTPRTLELKKDSRWNSCFDIQKRLRRKPYIPIYNGWEVQLWRRGRKQVQSCTISRKWSVLNRNWGRPTVRTNSLTPCQRWFMRSGTMPFAWVICLLNMNLLDSKKPSERLFPWYFVFLFIIFPSFLCVLLLQI